MRKSYFIVLSSFFLCASIAFNGGADCTTGPWTSNYNRNLGTATNINRYTVTIVPYSLPGQEQHGHTINEIFFLGRYTSGSDTTNLHLFCHEVDASTGDVVDADLGCVQQGVLDETRPLYVWPTDPEISMRAMSHYPVRYVTNIPPGKPASTNTRVEVQGVGNSSDGVKITAEG
jgi:hypothetical protein